LGGLVFIVTAMTTNKFFDLELFSSTSEYQPGYFVAMLIACCYPLASFLEGVLRLFDAIQNWGTTNNRQSPSLSTEVIEHATHSEAKATQMEQVLLIHGTGSADDEDAGEKWWQLDSEAARQLESKLPPDVSCHQQGVVFHWSGHNSEQARRNAGRELYRHLLTLEDAGHFYHLVAHSHGGSVVWHALQAAVRRSRDLSHLRSWTTLGTPFLRYRAKHTSLMLLIPFFATLALLALRTDVWQATSATWDLLVSRGYYPTTLILLSIAGALLLLVAYNLQRIVRATWASLSCRRDARTDKQVMRLYGSRWLGLWSRSDEAITGLQGTVRLSREGSVREPGDTLNPLHRLVRVFELPFRMIYDRLVRPIVDEFVWDRLIRKIQGNDLPEHRLKSVAATPDETFDCQPAGDDTEQEILAWANANCEKSGGLLRTSLGLASSSDYKLSQVGEHLASILNGKELVHWSYYQLDSLIEQVANHIRRHTVESRRELPLLTPSRKTSAMPGLGQATSGSSGIRALVAFQCVVLLAIALVAQMLDSYVLDQFTPERQVKEVVWRLPTISHFDERHTTALLAWAEEYSRAGVTDFDLLNEPEHRRVSDLDARVQLALVWASLEIQRADLAVKVANEIKNPFYRVHASILVCGASGYGAEELVFREDYAEDRALAQTVGRQVADAGTAKLLTRSAIMFREINFSPKSEWHLFHSAKSQGSKLAELAVVHSQAWAGVPGAIAQMLSADSNDGKMRRFSKLEFLIAMHPVENWFERANAIAQQILSDDNSLDFQAVPDLYARFGGLQTAVTLVNRLEQPLEDSKRRVYEFQIFLALRRYALLNVTQTNEAAEQDLLDQLAASNRILDRAISLASDGDAMEALDTLSDDDDLRWLPTNYIKQQIIAALVRQGHTADARKLTDVMIQEADDLDRDSHLTPDVARDLASALTETRQYFLARDMAQHISDTADRLQIYTAILSAYTNHLVEQGEPPDQHYVALYEAKDRELGLRRSSGFEFQLFEGTTW
jgi:hypothetical protein